MRQKAEMRNAGGGTGVCEGHVRDCAAENTSVPESYLRMLCFSAGSRECSDMSEYSDFPM